MATEDFQESEVIFADHDDGYSYRYARCSDNHQKPDSRIYNDSSRNSNNKSSLPINIPGSATVFRCSHGCGNDVCDGGSGEMEPPHVILGQRIGREMGFSVCTGNGRTLKGRDLSQVRNSVLRMTGFLET